MVDRRGVSVQVIPRRISWHYDVNADDKTDSNDAEFYFVYDERWRIVATYREDDSDPKEQFVHHNAGLDGMGGSSYIDLVVLRDKDANTNWDAASDGTLEERNYHCQNWRADVVALVDDAGELVEQDRYSSYGIPLGMHSGDVDSDGDVDASDASQINTWISSGYDVRGDLDLDGTVDSTDETKATNNSGRDLAWGKLSDVGVRTALAGYQLDDALVSASRVYHIRNRVLNADLGRWKRRDPLGNVDGPTLVGYIGSNPLYATDPSGLVIANPCPGAAPPDPFGGGETNYTVCCSAYFAAQPGLGGVTICCPGQAGGQLINCINDDLIYDVLPGPQLASDTVIACLAACESNHCPNFNCEGVPDFDGEPNNTPGTQSLECSECGAYECLVGCLEAVCNTGNCGICGGNDECEAWINNLANEMKQKRDCYCAVCNDVDPWGVPCLPSVDCG